MKKSIFFLLLLGASTLTAQTNLKPGSSIISKTDIEGNSRIVTKLPEGNYTIRLLVTGIAANANISAKVENRRLMVLNHEIAINHTDTLSFIVHRRDSVIHSDHSMVLLKPSEHNYLHWDDKLTIEISGKNFLLKDVLIDTLQYTVPTIFLAGNSTVVDQSAEPWASWGQMLPVMLNTDSVVVANYAESGETIMAFVRENRLKKIFSLAKPGDYLFIEFAHNDQKSGINHLDAFTSYADSLKSWASQAKSRGITPVFVTSTNRRTFDENGHITNSLGDYPAAMKQTAKQLNVPLIDLNAMTKNMYEYWGAEKSKKAFVHFPANTFPDQKNELKDDTHFTNFGAFEIARCIATSIAHSNLAIASLVLPSYRNFNSMKPDSFEDVYIPASSSKTIRKPEGN